ncbi:MAG TPA: DUF4998 domain-containing protein [Bacteroidales bacterium]|nr:DUF4998 domain-containing protein [Bacteroidales bacterium]
MKLKNNILKNGFWFTPFCLLIFVGSVLFSCGPMDETYRDFIKNGEIIYTGKVDSLKAFPGKNRMKLTWQLVSDPKITKNVVYWNDFKDSLSIDVVKTDSVDRISVVIDSLDEKVYTFVVYSYDAAGHSSVKSSVIGTVYGNNYTSTLYNRSISSNAFNTAKDTLTIKWFGVSAQAVVMNINYTDVTNALRSVTDVPVKDPNFPNRAKALADKTFLPKYKQGTSFTYRTGYMPNSDCIDTVYTNWSTPILVP